MVQTKVVTEGPQIVAGECTRCPFRIYEEDLGNNQTRLTQHVTVTGHPVRISYETIIRPQDLDAATRLLIFRAALKSRQALGHVKPGISRARPRRARRRPASLHARGHRSPE